MSNLSEIELENSLIKNCKICNGRGDIIKNNKKLRCFCSQKLSMKKILGDKLFYFFDFPKRDTEDKKYFYNDPLWEKPYLFISTSRKIDVYKALTIIIYRNKIAHFKLVNPWELIEADLGSDKEYANISQFVEGVQFFCLILGDEYDHAGRDPAVFKFLNIVLKKRNNRLWVINPYVEQTSLLERFYGNHSLSVFNRFNKIKI